MTKLTIDTTNLSQEDMEQLEAIKAKAEKPKWVNNWAIMAVQQGNEAYEFHGMHTVELRNMYFTDSLSSAEYIASQLEIYAQLLEAYVAVVGDWRPDTGKMYHRYDCHAAAPRLKFKSHGQKQKWSGMIGHLLPKLGV